jgi:hypothetical protein
MKDHRGHVPYASSLSQAGVVVTADWEIVWKCICQQQVA